MEDSTGDSLDALSRWTVTVRRPLQGPSPWRRLSARWRVVAERRRLEREKRRESDEESPWWALGDLASVFDGPGAVVLALLAVGLLVAFVLVLGPFAWLVVLFLFEVVVWLVIAIVGLLAWLLFGRPWQVVVADSDGESVAAASVRGRRSAHAHALVVEQRLVDGLDPGAAVRHP